MISKIKNEALKNASITTSFGKFSFNSSGIIPTNKLPKNLLHELLQLDGFIGLDAQGNPVERGEVEEVAQTAESSEEKIPEEDKKTEPAPKS